MAKTVFDVLNEKIAAHRNAVADSLVSGASKDYAEYRELCCWLQQPSLGSYPTDYQLVCSVDYCLLFAYGLKVV